MRSNMLMMMLSFQCVLMLQYMERGSLRKILNIKDMWKQQYTPSMRRQIVCDIAEGMEYLHAQDVFHRDLKRYVGGAYFEVHEHRV
jgi:serine/threonine protein kinase